VAIKTINVVIISCVYKPEPLVSASLAYDLARELVELGHKVSVLCPFPSRPKGRIYTGFKRSLYLRSLDTYRISLIRVFSLFSKNSTFISRFLENISFGISSSLYLLFLQKKPDVIFLNTWPVFATILNIFIAKVLGIRVIRSIQDIYPESLSSQKRLTKGNLFYRILQIVEQYNYRNSSANITISRMMGMVLADRYPRLQQPIVIPNWHSIPNQSKGVKKMQISSILSDNDLVFLYGGNISTASNIIGLVRAFTLFSIDKPNIKLVIAGSGPLLKSCMNIVRNHNAEDRICFHSPWASEDTLSLLNMADVLVLPTDNEQAKYSVPSKIISYMTACRPILSFGAIDSELAKCIIESSCGWFFDGVDQRKMQQGLEEASISSSKERLVMGLKGYDFMIDNFSRDVNLQKIINLLIEEN
jgi:glycosyltransferase involved in cell wall biosynthesis